MLLSPIKMCLSWAVDVHQSGSGDGQRFQLGMWPSMPCQFLRSSSSKSRCSFYCPANSHSHDLLEFIFHLCWAFVIFEYYINIRMNELLNQTKNGKTIRNPEIWYSLFLFHFQTFTNTHLSALVPIAPRPTTIKKEDLMD